MDIIDIQANKNVTRSCFTCSKAKARCVRQPDQSICDRCARLKKDCQSREPVIRQRKVTKASRAAQLEKLENKIEHLVNALSTSTHPQARPPDPGHFPAPESDPAHDFSGDIRQFHQTPILGSRSIPPNDVIQPQPDAPLRPPNIQAAVPTGLNLISTTGAQFQEVLLPEADVLLDRYQRLMSAAFPFVVLPDNISAHALRDEKPLLLRAITTVALFHDRSRQAMLVKDVLRDIGERILVKNEKSMGILQGILVLVSWFHPHLIYTQQVTNLLHLAIALGTDMGIDRLPQQRQDFNTATSRAVHGPAYTTRTPTSDERRAHVGLFFLTSMFASTFKKIDAMPYTRYIEDCLNCLEQRKEFESDIFAVQMVQAQRIIEMIHTTDSPGAPIKLHVRAFRADIERLRKVYANNDDNVFLQLEYLTAEVWLWELQLNEIQEKRVPCLGTHLDDLYQCAVAVKACLDAYFLIPSTAYHLIPFPVYGQFAHAYIVLLKLACLDLDGWSMRLVEDQLQFSQCIEEAAMRFEKAVLSAPDGITLNNDSFDKWAIGLRKMRHIYDAKLGQDKRGAPSQRRRVESYGAEPLKMPDHTNGQPTPPEDILSTDFFNYLDENFWHSFAGDFDLGFPEPIAK